MRDARVTRVGQYIAFDFRASAFLHHMVRNLVGALVYVGKGHYPPAWIEALLQTRDRVRAAPTFEPAGLYLSGGDVAIAVAQALGASGFQIQGLVAGCVPHGVLLNSDLHLPVMTKAGGFGDENTLVEAIRFIEEMSSE